MDLSFSEHQIKISLVCWLSLIKDVMSDTCPRDYPFLFCPRPGVDDVRATDCCHHPNEGYSCCIPPHVNGPGSIMLYIWLSIMVMALLSMALYCICYCCHRLYDYWSDHQIDLGERTPLVDSGVFV